MNCALTTLHWLTVVQTDAHPQFVALVGREDRHVLHVHQLQCQPCKLPGVAQTNWNTSHYQIAVADVLNLAKEKVPRNSQANEFPRSSFYNQIVLCAAMYKTFH